MMGAIAQWKLVQSHLKLRGACSALSLFFAVGLWYCASMVSFWAVSIRPDMAAVAVVMAALWIVVRQPRFAFAYAGVLFYLAWSFKQSVILALAGVCIFLLLHKRWRDLALLAAVFAALVSATLLLGSPEYGTTFWLLHGSSGNSASCMPSAAGKEP
jgi:cytochrome c oxidase subunit IV